MAVKKYKPVDCGFVDRVEDFAVRRAEGVIEYYDHGEKRKFKGKIVTWNNEAGEEFLITDPYNKIRLDMLISLFGVPGPAWVD